MESNTRISVSIRMRPLLKEEQDQGLSSTKLVIDKQSTSIL